MDALGPSSESLLAAARDGDLDEIKRLLAEGVGPNTFDENPMAPLHWAALKGHVEVVRFLLAHGADVNAHLPDEIGNTTLREVAETCSLEMAKILVGAGADPTIPGWMQLSAGGSVRRSRGPEGQQVHALLVESVKQFETKH